MIVFLLLVALIFVLLLLQTIFIIRLFCFLRRIMIQLRSEFSRSSLSI